MAAKTKEGKREDLRAANKKSATKNAKAASAGKAPMMTPPVSRPAIRPSPPRAPGFRICGSGAPGACWRR